MNEKDLNIISEAIEFKPVLTPNQFRQYHKNILKAKDDLLKDVLVLLEQSANYRGFIPIDFIKQRLKELREK